MFIALLFPIGDLRPFIAETNRLLVPNWPIPDAEREFIRGFGPIRMRKRGGAEGLIGEGNYCGVEKLREMNIDRASLFPGLDAFGQLLKVDLEIKAAEAP